MLTILRRTACFCCLLLALCFKSKPVLARPAGAFALAARLAQRLGGEVVNISFNTTGSRYSLADPLQKAKEPYLSIIAADSKLQAVSSHREGRNFCEGATGPEVTDGRFFIDNFFDYFYEPESCILRRLTGQEARTCLNDRHVAFVGDSVTRYQYLSLVYFLSKCQYMERYGDAHQRSLCWEGNWNGWDEFYATGSQILSGSVDAVANETCDCYRPKWEANTPWDRDLAHARETRIFRLSDFPINGSEPKRQPLGRMGSEGIPYMPESFLAISYHQAFAYPSFEEASIQALNRALRHRIPPHTAPDLLVANFGIWFPTKPENCSLVEAADIYRNIFRAGMETVDEMRLGTKLVWKTTTSSNRRWPGLDPAWADCQDKISDVAVRVGKEEGWTIFDARSVTEASNKQNLGFYWDMHHFLPLVYDQLNDVLLNMACTEDLKFGFRPSLERTDDGTAAAGEGRAADGAAAVGGGVVGGGLFHGWHKGGDSGMSRLMRWGGALFNREQRPQKD